MSCKNKKNKKNNKSLLEKTVKKEATSPADMQDNAKKDI